MKTFTLKEYEENENSNYHTENVYQLVLSFGTPEELIEITNIKERHEHLHAQFGISSKDMARRSELSEKYYSLLT